MRTKILIIVCIAAYLLLSCKASMDDNAINTKDSIANTKDSTVTLGKELMNLDDYNSSQLIEMADANYKINNYAEAIRILDKVIMRDSTYGRAYYIRGNSFGGIQELEKSTQDYQTAIKLGYKEASCNYNIGLNFLPTSDSLALYYFNKAILLDPSHRKAKRLKKMVERNSIQKGRKRG
jgi:Tfp pilus assembly protein PilF